MKKETFLNHCKNVVKNGKESMALPSYFANVDLSKEEREAILKLGKTHKQGKSSWQMVNPTKVVEILQEKAPPPKKEETPEQKAAKLEKASTALAVAMAKHEDTLTKWLSSNKTHKSAPNAKNKKKETAAKKALTKAKSAVKKAQEALDKLQG